MRRLHLGGGGGEGEGDTPLFVAVTRNRSKISALAPKEHQIRMRSDERDFYFCLQG